MTAEQAWKKYLNTLPRYEQDKACSWFGDVYFGAGYEAAKAERDILYIGIEELLNDMHVPMSIKACRRLQALQQKIKEL